jgi:uncharacterized membrane protein YfhO
VKDGAEAARVVLNQNWSPGWRTNAGAITVGPRTELSKVTIPAGTTGEYEFAFVPPGFIAGAAIFVTALVASAIFWRLRVRPIVPAQPLR